MKRLIAALAIAAAAIPACGGNDSAPRPRTTSGGPITTTAPPPLDETNFVLDQHFWHDGFRVDLAGAEVWTTQARFTNRLSYWLTLRGRFENFGATAAYFEPEMAILFDGLVLSRRQGNPPQVGAGSAEPGELTFLVPDDFEYQRAELVVGALGENRARVPLGPEGEAVRLEPRAVAVDGSGAVQLLELTLTGAVLRYDDPASHSTAAEDTMTLTVSFDLLSWKEGSGRLVNDDIELKLPDGSIAAPDWADLGAVDGSEGGTLTEDQMVRFIVDADGAGDYTLLITPRQFAAEGEAATIEIDFSL